MLALWESTAASQTIENSEHAKVCADEKSVYGATPCLALGTWYNFRVCVRYFLRELMAIGTIDPDSW